MTTSSKAHALQALPGDASPSPLYQQIKDHILERIHAGHWPPGSKIPSENALVRELDVSRMTVNRALRELSQEGHLHRVAGVGSFVSEPPRHASLIELRNIADEIHEQGGRHHARRILQRMESLDAPLADKMQRPVGSPVAHIQLVHHQNDLPIQLEDRWVDPEVVPDFMDVDFTEVTPSEHLLRSVRPHEMEHMVQARMPDAATCQLLAIDSAEPCLQLERRTWNRDRVVTFAILTYPSSRYHLGARYTLGPR